MIYSIEYETPHNTYCKINYAQYILYNILHIIYNAYYIHISFKTHMKASNNEGSPSHHAVAMVIHPFLSICAAATEESLGLRLGI